MSRIETEIAANAAAVRASFDATLAFGRLVLAMLFTAGVLGWAFGSQGPGAFLWAIVATAFAYLAQFLYTAIQDRAGMAAQLLCVLAAVFAFIELAV